MEAVYIQTVFISRVQDAGFRVHQRRLCRPRLRPRGSFAERKDPRGHAMLNIKDDVRLAYRRLSQRPGFTAVALLTLALGLGANTAIFTLVRASMHQTLPVDRPEELVRLGADGNCCVNSGMQRRYSLFSYPAYEYLRDHTPELQSLVAFQANIRPIGLRREGTSVTESL